MDLRGNGTDLSKLYPSGDTNIGYSANTMTAHYVHVVPNSHFWSDLNQIITSFDLHPQELTKEYLSIGLLNSIKNGYRIVRIKHPERLRGMNYFASIDEMIDFINTDKYDNQKFYDILKKQCAIGINLTNGRKMERTEVYKRLDTERDYQDLRWTPRRAANGVKDEEKPPAEWINYMEFHLTEAKNAVYRLNDEEALAQVRKVAALAVRCLELHGCPERVIPEELLNSE